MEKLTLQNPITINGKKVKTLTYDTDAITVGMFADAEARKLRATSNKGGGSAGACELDYSLHAYLAMMAIVAVNSDIDVSDLERISDHSLNIGETAQELYTKQIVFSPAGSRELHVMLSAVTRILELTISAFLTSLPHLSRRAPTGTPDRLPDGILRGSRGGQAATRQGRLNAPE